MNCLPDGSGATSRYFAGRQLTRVRNLFPQQVPRFCQYRERPTSLPRPRLLATETPRCAGIAVGQVNDVLELS
jgi:hypothetical protein